MLSATKLPPGASLSIFKLTMMAVVAIDSLKNLSANAQYGTSLLLFYGIATLLFFIPSALVAAELSTAWPETGGIYVWVREAFGKRVAFLAVWIQWIYNLVWYPTILSFIAVVMAYWVDPDLGKNKYYVLIVILGIFWLTTFLSRMKIRFSSYISTTSAIVGVIIPMLIIMLLGVHWMVTKHPTQIEFTVEQMTTNMWSSDHLRLFVNLMFSLMGIEMVAAHAGDVKKPERDYPLSILFSAVLILGTVIPASLAIALVISPHQISLTGGVIDAFIIFLNTFGLGWAKSIIVLCVALGSFGIFFVFLLSSSRCLLIAAKDGCLPKILGKSNENDMPTSLFWAQGLIFSILASVFLLMPSVNNSFWLLTASSAQLALVYYIFLFAAALRLRYKRPDVRRPFRVGKTPALLWVICSVAIMVCLAAIGFGFLPPSDLGIEHIMRYEITLVVLMVLCIGTGFIRMGTGKK